MRHQQLAYDWLMTHDHAGLFLGMGLGKTVTTLTAQRPEGEEEAEATWRSGGANVTDSPTVQALLEDLGS